MEQNITATYIESVRKYLPKNKMVFVKDKMEKIDDARFTYVCLLRYKNPVLIQLISIFLGVFGIDRFLVGDIGMGLLKLLTGGSLGIFWIWDVCSIYRRTKEVNYYRLMSVIG